MSLKMIRKKRKSLSKNSLQLRINPANSFSIPEDAPNKKKKISQEVETGTFKKKEDEIDEWSTCSSSIERMRDTDLDSEWCPDLLMNRQSLEAEKKGDVSDCFQQIKQLEFLPQATSSPTYSIRSDDGLGKNYIRKNENFDISPIKDSTGQRHFFYSDDDLDLLSSLHLSESNEILGVDEILVQNSDKKLEEEPDSPPPIFTESAVPVINDWSANDQGDLVVTNIDPVDTSDEELQNIPCVSHSNQRNACRNAEFQNNTYITHSNKRNVSRKKQSAYAVKPSKESRNTIKKSDGKSSSIVSSERYVMHQKIDTLRENDDSNVSSSELSYIQTSTDKIKSTNEFRRKRKANEDIYDFHEESDSSKRKPTKSAGNRGKKRSFYNISVRDSGRTSASERAKLIKRLQNKLKRVPICCLTTLKCSQP